MIQTWYILQYSFSVVDSRACARLAHPQAPTTTPLYRRVAKNPHIGGLVSHRHHV